jgi:hypothetical protein
MDCSDVLRDWKKDDAVFCRRITMVAAKVPRVYIYVSMVRYFHSLTVMERRTTKFLQGVQEKEANTVSHKVPSLGPFVDLYLKRSCMHDAKSLPRERRSLHEDQRAQRRLCP